MKCDVAVIGAGPGGYTAAFRAADLGLSVALIDTNPHLGGVCLNVGCIPSKALLNTAEIIQEAKELSNSGVSFSEPTIDIKKLISHKDSIITKLTAGLKGLSKLRKVTVITAEAHFQGPHQLTLSNGNTLDFNHCIIATGSKPISLFKEHPNIIDSSGALSPEKIPESMLIVGGGIIGLEMACIYSALGTKITIAEFQPLLLPDLDRATLKPLLNSLKHMGVRVLTSTAASNPQEKNNFMSITLTSNNTPQIMEFEKILVCVGRKPNSDLSLAHAGVATDEAGCIPSDDQMRTNVPHIFSIGDVRSQPMLAHKATHEAKVAAEVISGKKSFLDIRTIPSVAYTNPELAWCGITQKQAEEQKIAFESFTIPWNASGKALAIGADDGITKIMVDPKTRRILGAQICGQGAGDLISEAMLAYEMGATDIDIAHTIHPHPTLSETLAMSAEAAAGSITDLYFPKE